MNIFTKFHKDWSKIVDFLLLAKFWAWALFFYSPSTCQLVMQAHKGESILSYLLGVPA